MAPISTQAEAIPSEVDGSKASHGPITGLDIQRLYLEDSQSNLLDNYEFKDLLPTFPDLKWEPLPVHEYTDRALSADPTFPTLFKSVTRVEHLTPKFGSVLHGADLSKLSDSQKDELALFTAYRGVVFFKDQRNLDIKKQLELGRYWGRLHRHATTGIPREAENDPNLLDVHVVYASEKRATSLGGGSPWHSDVSYEKQPPSYTTLKLLHGPPTGGDTAWGSAYGLYDSLSPRFQRYLEGLTALHSAVEQADGARRLGKTIRREPVITEHPIVRTHPVTGYKGVYVNPGFTRRIVGVPGAESEFVLKYLFKLIEENISHTARWHWDPQDVALWDNRSTVHAASYGFYPHRRHAVRVTTHGEVPYFDGGKSEQETIDATLGLHSFEKDCAKPPAFAD